MDFRDRRRGKSALLSSSISTFLYTFIGTFIILFVINYIRSPTVSDRVQERWEYLSYFGVDNDVLSIEQEITALKAKQDQLLQATGKYQVEIGALSRKIRSLENIDLSSQRKFITSNDLNNKKGGNKVETSEEIQDKRPEGPCAVYQFYYLLCEKDFDLINATYNDVLQRNEALISDSLREELNKIINSEKDNTREFGQFD